jgi:hypothetical protein
MLINLLQCKGQAHNKIIKKEKKVVWYNAEPVTDLEEEVQS